MKRKLLITLTLLLALCLVFSGCKDKIGPQPPDIPGEGGVTPMPGGDNPIPSGEAELPDEVSPNELNITVDLSSLSEKTDSDGSSVINGSSEKLTITEAGGYVLRGNFNGGIEITVGDKETVHLFLENADISNENGIALSNTNKKSSVIVTAVNGTINGITNDGDNVNAIHVKGKLSLNGKGTLNITSNSKSAVKVSKELYITDVALVINAANHAIAARSIEIQNASINVTYAGKDGLNAECNDDVTAFPEELEGYVALKDVNYTANVKGDGIQADTACYISGGTIDITTQGDFVSYSVANMSEYGLTGDDYRFILSGGKYKKVASDYNGSVTKRYALIQSCKGIKVGEIKYEDESGNEISVLEGNYTILITDNPTINVNSTDDALHTNSGDVIVESGTITLTTLDDGITADRLSLIKDGTIAINECYEGIEGGYVKIEGGSVEIHSSDDGINAASDDNTVKEYIIISGGKHTVYADGDGLDSNGSILISGGTLIVFGPTSGADSALDADKGIIINGGSVFAFSYKGMVETPSNNSSQCVIALGLNTTLKSGTLISVKTSKGEHIASLELEKSCQALIISLPDFVIGETYSIYAGDSKLTDITINATVTTSGINGGFNGGPGRPGENRP